MRLQDLDLKNKKVLVRVDFNVPQDVHGKITDDTRIRTALPTIRYLLDNGASVILMSHLGRPKGQKNPNLTLKPCAQRLEKLLNIPVAIAPDCVGKKTTKMAASLQPGQILLLENLRFHAAEEKPSLDPNFAKQLSELADIYVNDAFGTAHRQHSSTATIARYFPGVAAFGFLLEKEIEFLHSHFAHPKHPFYAVIGGAKISSKLGVLKSLLKKVDALFIGGGMAYTFLKAQGIEIGNSLFEENLLEEAASFLNAAKGAAIPLYLPKDLVIADQFSNDAKSKIIEVKQGIPKGWEGVDIGPITRNQWENTLQNGQMIFWNGPLGVFEFSNFAKGTQSIAQALAKVKGVTIIGGGDSVAAVNQLGISEKFTHISTGGGACLEYIEYGHLPGIDAITSKKASD